MNTVLRRKNVLAKVEKKLEHGKAGVQEKLGASVDFRMINLINLCHHPHPLEDVGVVCSSIIEGYIFAVGNESKSQLERKQKKNMLDGTKRNMREAPSKRIYRLRLTDALWHGFEDIDIGCPCHQNKSTIIGGQAYELVQALLTRTPDAMQYVSSIHRMCT